MGVRQFKYQFFVRRFADWRLLWAEEITLREGKRGFSTPKGHNALKSLSYISP